ncbi:MAG TPA: 3-oxoacyl-ACP reductase family protein [Kofleriaceae bacterium]|nr:3-oxoacyl-ACP reductase family protein [Kofleriaceae bacterium]
MAIRDRALDGCVALVTGGSRGIGRAVCVALAGRGARVVVNYRERRDAADETVALCEAAGGAALTSGFDVADRAQVSEAIDRIAAEQGGLHILVNNAGIALNGLLLRYKDADWDRTMAVNLGGVYSCSKAAARHLLKAKERGRAIHLTSVVGEMGNPGQIAYAAAKAAVIGFTRSMAREVASRGVTVNAVAPGYVETDMTAEHLPEAARAQLMAQIPMSRIGSPDDVAGVVAFLAGPEAAYVTGQVLRVNGGLLM